MSPVPKRAWSFLVVDEGERQHQGNQGYDDDPSSYYSWDSTVANREGPSDGDICAVRDSRGLLGISRIDDVARRNGEKARSRCPECESTAFKSRATMQPIYKCSHCMAEFDQPLVEKVPVTIFRADYARSWVPVDGAVTAGELEADCYRSRAKQHAIRPVDPEALREVLTRRQLLVGDPWWQNGGSVEPPEIPGGYRELKGLGRIGQQEFRRQLLARFGPVCAFSGPQPVRSLHAAHVIPYSDDARHELAGGLLLRADLHALFDARLITIDGDLKIRIDSSLRSFPELSRLDGASLQIRSGDSLMPTLRKILKQREASA
ncbi:MAG: HNH endonuclease [Actinobacteria bacterium]|nr:HNH endonuclease [Actinomycetota bacterium]